MIPKSFFITSGVGMAHDRDAAFDLALQDAGIGECNLVVVSSILPAKAEEVDKDEMARACTPGEITFCVLSRMAGKSGELIGAGVGYGWLRDSANSPVFGIVSEHHGHHSRDYLESKIRDKLKTMAESRNMNENKKLQLDLKRIEVKTAVVEEHKFGSVVAALVFV